jgi:hypothetical protein
MGTWTNSDGLKIDLGITEARDQDATYAPAGEYRSTGPNRVQEQVVDLTKLNAFGTVTILNDRTYFGAGWVPEEIEVETIVAATGATATLSIGLVKNLDRTTAISATAFVNAITVASIAAVGTKLRISAGSTGAGANIGVATTFDALWTATVGTANFTAGKVKIRVYYRPTVAI